MRAFVTELKQRAQQEYNAFAGLRTGDMPEGMAANVFEEPPDFDEPGKNRAEKKPKTVRIADIDTSIQMLEQYLDDEEIERLFEVTRRSLQEWTERLRDEFGARFPEKITAFHPAMVAHGKFGEPCPVCGDPDRPAGRPPTVPAPVGNRQQCSQSPAHDSRQRR